MADTAGLWVCGAVLGSYAAGTFPTAQLVARRSGVDPTRAGSGNPGTTNVLRTVGRRAGALTLVGDVAKGAAAASLGLWLGGTGVGLACGVAAVVGHVLPITRGFRGGKGVAAAAGMCAVLYPVAVLVAGIGFAATVWRTHVVALGSLSACVTLPVTVGLLGREPAQVWVLAACALLVVWAHRSNLSAITGEGRVRPGRGRNVSPTSSSGGAPRS